MEIGGEMFCMLSDVEVQYTWSANNQVVAQYSILNGEVTILEGDVDAETLTVTVAPFETTTYELSREAISFVGVEPEDFEFCTVAEEITIIVPDDTPTADFNFTNDFCETIVLFSSAETSQVDHLWDFAGLGTSTAANPTWDFLNPGTYTVTHTISNECFNTSMTIDITIEACDCPCIGDNAYNIDARGGLLLSESTLPSESISGECITITGTLIINKDYDIFESELTMYSGAQIIIQDGYDVRITKNSYLHGCKEMWRGIVVERGASLLFNNNQIEDAQYAIHTQNNSTLTLNDNIFEKNYIGLAIHPAAETQDVTLTTPMAENHFTCAGTLLPPYEGQFPTPKAKTFAGIWLNDVVFIVGSEEKNYTNYFNQCNYGIWTNNSLVGVYDTEITNLVDEYETSSGIYGKENSLIVAGNNILDQMYYGITANNSYINAGQNTLRNIRLGIIQREGIAGTFIRNNDINFTTGYGIDIQNTPTNIHPDISNNTIIGESEHITSGIRLLNLYSSSNNRIGLISNNTIRNNHGRGIRMTNVPNLKVYDNTIRLTNTNFNSNSVGLHLTNTENLSIRNNNITGTNSATGIYTFASTNNQYCCNRVEGHGTGLSFSGFCDRTKLLYSNIGSNRWRGLRCNAGTIIGIQKHHGNLWNGSYSIAAARHSGSFDEKEASEFIIENMNQPLWPVDGEDFDPAWFVVDNSDNASTCELDTNCGVHNLQSQTESTITTNDIKTATTGYPTSEYQDMLNWKSSLYLFERLVEHPELLGQHLDVDAFYSLHQTTNVGKFYDIKNDIEDLYQPNPTFVTEMDNHQAELLGLYQSVLSIDSLYQYATTLQDSLDLIEQKRGFLQAMTSPYQALNTVLGLVKTEKIAKVNATLAKNNLIVPQTVLETNLHTVHQVYLETMASSIFELDEEQLSLMEAIAFQCPEEGGKAVYTARMLYQLNKENIEFDDDELCNLELRNKHSHKQTIKHLQNDQISIRPNPASQVFEIQFNQSFSQPSIYFEMRSIEGARILQKELDPTITNHQVDLQNISSGIYIYSIWDSKHLIKTDNLGFGKKRK